jgi:hypothetical protein
MIYEEIDFANEKIVLLLKRSSPYDKVFSLPRCLCDHMVIFFTRYKSVACCILVDNYLNKCDRRVQG